MKRFAGGSVRSRIVLIYFMLVFIAMTLVSVYLINRIESYQISSLKENIASTVSESNLRSFLGKYDSIQDNAEDIQKTLDESWMSYSEELSVVSDRLTICASTNSNLVGRTAADVFDADIIVASLMSGENGESSSYISENIPVENLSFAIKNPGGEISGVIYVRADLSSINSFVSQSKFIFMQAIFFVLVGTVILGFILAKSITEPINEVTKIAGKMSQGDFSEDVSVKSDDEIGKLAEMFNIMRAKLDFTLTEISNEKNKLSTILTYMADGLIAMNLEGKLIHINPAARKMLRIYMDAELEGIPYDEVLGKRAPNMSFEHIKENCSKEGGEEVFRFGPSIYAARYDRFKDDEGLDIGIIIIMQDITERQKLEDMQTDFVANVSHELKTPLTTIKSYTETLLDGALEDKETAAQFLSVVDNEADRMTRLVKDLLQLSRLDHSNEVFNLKESNIVSLVNASIMKMEMNCAQKQQSLNTLYDIDDEIKVFIDRDRMEQVMINVLSNASKYTQEGGKIDVGIERRPSSVIISVADNGMGISEEELPRIFERFYRVDKARSRAMGGTGLGLAITKQIVEGHNGTIEAESEPGRGTKFIITLPLSVRKGVPNIE